VHTTAPGFAVRNVDSLALGLGIVFSEAILRPSGKLKDARVSDVCNSTCVMVYAELRSRAGIYIVGTVC